MFTLLHPLRSTVSSKCPLPLGNYQKTNTGCLSLLSLVETLTACVISTVDEAMNWPREQQVRNAEVTGTITTKRNTSNENAKEKYYNLRLHVEVVFDSGGISGGGSGGLGLRVTLRDGFRLVLLLCQGLPLSTPCNPPPTIWRRHLMSLPVGKTRNT